MMELQPIEVGNIHTPPKSQISRVQVPSMLDTKMEEQAPNVEEPPEAQPERTPRATAPKATTNSEPTFDKSIPSAHCHRTSLLTKILHSSESEDAEEHYPTNISRGLSNASTWSNPSTISTADLTSDGGLTSPARTSTPSPPLPPTTYTIPLPSKTPDSAHVFIRNPQADEHIGPLNLAPASEQAVEATLGRKRCITFECGGKKENRNIEAAKPAEEPTKRPCALRFICPTRVEKEGPIPNGPTGRRLASPPPPVKRKIQGSPIGHRVHRDSDSTIRNTSPKAVRKIPSTFRVRKYSSDPESRPGEATRFCEFANSDNEEDDWTQESTCFRNRLTVEDTLKIENNLRQLAQEAEEEAMEEEDEDNDSAEEDLDEDEDEDDEGDLGGSRGKAAAYDSESEDDGFQTDDEEGFAVSDDDDDDVDSEYDWWAPGRSITGSSTEPLDHIRPSSRRTLSRSSLESVEDGHVSPFSMPKPTRRGRPIKKQKPINVRPQSPELPDSTDFVCGTLDEDRPLEEAYKAELERRKAAKHKPVPQDIDPTFPTSEFDEEDDDEDEDDDEEDSVNPKVDESDQITFPHAKLDLEENADARGRHRSPKRLRSPPPTKRGIHRSPPPRKLFGSSPRRLRSPPPGRLRSPPPTRRTSFIKAEPNVYAQPVLAQRPRPIFASSLPRNTHASGPYCLLQQPYRRMTDRINEDDYGIGSAGASGTLASGAGTPLPTRGAIDIVKGLEKKRQRRREMLYQKHCRRAAATTGKDKDKGHRKPQPGKGAERMRYVGLGAAAYRGTLAAKNYPAAAIDGQGVHMLSF